MLSIFSEYNIIPIFIFDGKPPIEKKELLQKRLQDKKKAQEEYNKLNIILYQNTNIDNYEKQEIIENMASLKKQFTYINKTQIDDVKKLIRAYGMTYVDAPSEADVLCAKLVLKEKVWACLSEDMDMFVYGVNKVIKYFSLLNHTVVLYDIKSILNQLEITQSELRQICVISGTDYNIKNLNNKEIPNLFKTIEYFQKYCNEKDSKHHDDYIEKDSKHQDDYIENHNNFYDWLLENTNYITDYNSLQKVYSMFDILNIKENCDELTKFNNIKIMNTTINIDEINKILKKDGFIFPI
jgi:flap endonuclease-1